MRHLVLTLSALMLLAAPAAAQHDHAQLNERGQRFMGFDQDTTVHHFVLTKDGGRIEVAAKPGADAATTGQIRDHLRHIAGVFSTGDFNLPALIHDTKAVPGVEAMKAQLKAGTLAFSFEEADRGGAVRITGRSPEAIAAVHQFLRFQITDHKTGDPLTVK